MKHVQKFIRQQGGQGYVVFEIDTKKSTYKGQPLHTLGSGGRRKFENLIFLEGAAEKLPMKFIYH